MIKGCLNALFIACIDSVNISDHLLVPSKTSQQQLTKPFPNQLYPGSISQEGNAYTLCTSVEVNATYNKTQLF